jgi:hypothetical protein
MNSSMPARPDESEATVRARSLPGMRVYLPVSQAMLRRLFGDGTLPGPLPACAVTPALIAWFGAADVEEYEYAAQSRAADLSLAVIGGDTPVRRALLAIDTTGDLDALGGPALAPDVDELVGVTVVAVRVEQVVALLADAPDAEPALVAALHALATSDDPCPPEVDLLDEHELAWFAPEELGPILARGSAATDSAQ